MFFDVLFFSVRGSFQNNHVSCDLFFTAAADKPLQEKDVFSGSCFVVSAGVCVRLITLTSALSLSHCFCAVSTHWLWFHTMATRGKYNPSEAMALSSDYFLERSRWLFSSGLKLCNFCDIFKLYFSFSAVSQLSKLHNKHNNKPDYLEIRCPFLFSFLVCFGVRGLL